MRQPVFTVIITGRIKIFKLSTEGKVQILHFLGQGEPIREVAVFTGRRFPAHAEALDNSRLFFFPRDAFTKLVHKNPSIACICWPFYPIVCADLHP
jgi:CRP/FNR family transcriptional regulator